MQTRRSFLLTAFLSTTAIAFPRAAASAPAFIFGIDPLDGRAATDDDYAVMIAGARTRRQEIAQASEATLRERCAASLDATKQAQEAIRRAQTLALDSANAESVMASISFAVNLTSAVVGVFVSSTATFPILAIGTLFVASSAFTAMSIGAASSSGDPQDAVIVVATYVTSRLSILAVPGGVAGSAGWVLKGFGFVAVIADAHAYWAAGEDYAAAQSKLVEAQDALAALAVEAEAMAADAERCRAMLLEAVDLTIDGLERLRAMRPGGGFVDFSLPPIILH